MSQAPLRSQPSSFCQQRTQVSREILGCIIFDDCLLMRHRSESSGQKCGGMQQYWTWYLGLTSSCSSLLFAMTNIQLYLPKEFGELRAFQFQHLHKQKHHRHPHYCPQLLTTSLTNASWAVAKWEVSTAAFAPNLHSSVFVSGSCVCGILIMTHTYLLRDSALAEHELTAAGFSYNSDTIYLIYYSPEPFFSPFTIVFHDQPFQPPLTRLLFFLGYSSGFGHSGGFCLHHLFLQV